MTWHAVADNVFPDKGRQVLVYSPTLTSYGVAIFEGMGETKYADDEYWDEDAPRWTMLMDDNFTYYGEITHWHLLPEPPQ